MFIGVYTKHRKDPKEASFAESYLGGNKDDYDVIKPGDGWPSPPIEATDGNLDAFRKIWDLCVSGFQTNTNYFKIQGLNEDGTANPNYKNLVDVDNLIDFMIIVFYTGNFDCPISKFGNNNTPRNFYTIYNRNANEGFKFIAHDAEHSLRTTEGEGPGIGLNENRVNIGTLNDYYKMIVTEFNLFHPQWLHFKLSDNAEYKIKFADHVYKYFFNDGLMTSEKATELFNKRADEISTAIIAESARWGDVYHTPSRNKDDDWQIAVDDIVDNYFPYRGDIVLTQFKDTDLFLKINPPSFFHDNKEIFSNTLEVNSGYSLKIQKPTNMNGTIQYTIDGTDPRETGGNVNISTKNGGNEVEITINTTIVIEARLLNGSTWSALHELTLLAGNDVGNFKITEIHYHPLDQDSTSDNEFEFLELKNTGNVPINLSGTSLVEGINYSFPIGTIIETNKFLVLASNRVEFNNRYGFLPFGQYSGQLDNGGEKISFVGSTNDTIFSIIYDDKSPWPETPDGGGYSLVQKELNPTGDLNDPNSWRASYFINGSPGEDDLPTSIGTNEKELPTSSSLYQNFPNPFNPSTIISYRLSVISKVSLKVYDLLGREVATLVNEEQQPEIYNSQFSILDLPAGRQGSQLPSGVYFYRLQAGDFYETKKMILIK